MLLRSSVAQALEGQRETFLRSAERAAQARHIYQGALELLQNTPIEEVERALAGEEWPGARPTPELADRGLLIPFQPRFDHAQAARAWAAERLRGVTTAAVDGSQIVASKEFGVQVSLIQAGWFINPHHPNLSYIKDIRHEVIIPDDEADLEEQLFNESRVNQRRFVLEMAVAEELLFDLPADPPSVLYIDGSLVLSFAGRLVPPVRETYINAVLRLLDASERARIPVVGYVDNSYAADLAGMLRAWQGLAKGGVTDGRLLDSHLQPLDRTAALQCARDDVMKHYGGHAGDIHCLYLKAGAEHLPVRLEVPRWVAEAGLLDHVADVTRAEIIAGAGYPYVVETADALAVLTVQDRLDFYGIFHDFAHAEGIDASLPAKSISKGRRR